MKGRRLIHYILMIAIADTIISIFIALGYPAPHTTTCAVQGHSLLQSSSSSSSSSSVSSSSSSSSSSSVSSLLSSLSLSGFVLYFFSKMSWFYTDVLIFQLFHVIVYKRFFLKIKYNHMFVWTLNLILQLGPYTTGNTYGQDDDGTGIPVIRCALGAGSGGYRTEYAWISDAFQLELIISFVFIGFFTIAILVYCFQMSRSYGGNTYLSPNVRNSWSTVILYPLGMLVTYVPSVVFGHIDNTHFENHHVRLHHGYVIRDYLQASNALYGVFLAIIFYWKTEVAVEEWKSIISDIFYGKSVNRTNFIRETELSISTVPSLASSDGTSKILTSVNLTIVNPFGKNETSNPIIQDDNSHL